MLVLFVCSHTILPLPGYNKKVLSGIPENWKYFLIVLRDILMLMMELIFVWLESKCMLNVLKEISMLMLCVAVSSQCVHEEQGRLHSSPPLLPGQFHVIQMCKTISQRQKVCWLSIFGLSRSVSKLYTNIQRKFHEAGKHSNFFNFCMGGQFHFITKVQKKIPEGRNFPIFNSLGGRKISQFSILWVAGSRRRPNHYLASGVGLPVNQIWQKSETPPFLANINTTKTSPPTQKRTLIYSIVWPLIDACVWQI